VLDALSPPRRRLVFGAGALLLLLVVVLIVAAVVRLVPGKVQPVPQDQLGPVLVVPGYGGRTASVAPLVAALRAGGREAVVVAALGDGSGDLQAEATHLGVVATSVLNDTHAPSVDVIGYSAGGVVARLWVRDGGGAFVARRVLTLGSPQHGTSQAALGSELGGGCPPACAQLVPDSDLLRRLNAGDETPDGPRWITVLSTADRVVSPVRSAALAGALNIVVQDICPGAVTPHNSLPGDPVVLAALGSALGPEEPVAPARVNC
jgi:triacylglycerol esterase/lipase EstA (alpha/beta hydrolase family)